MNLAAIRSTKWANKEPFGSLWGHAASASETFRTVSLGSTLAFEVERGRVRSSPVRSKRGDLKVRTLPATMIRLLVPFAPLFSRGVFRHAQVLLVGTILAPGRRTVSSALRAMGLDQERRFHRYHRVLSQACS